MVLRAEFSALNKEIRAMADLIYRDIVIRQGAEYRAEYQRVKARYVFEAMNVGTSGAVAPTWPTELDSTVLDNDILWLNQGLFDEEEHSEIDVWLASRAYARRAKVVTPLDPVDLTGYTGAFQIRSTVDAADPPIHNGAVDFGARNEGKFNMIIDTASTTAFTFNDAVYDLELSTAGGEVDFVLRGNAKLVKEVTR